MKPVIYTISLFLSLALFSQIPGQVIDSVICKNKTQYSYALYLPSNYTGNKKWPIVYFFEPAARGKLPVTIYSEVAEELGYILACSNNSKNGNFNDNFDAADAVFSDTYDRFSLDEKKMILSGFSGGSRAALSIAVITNKVYGVIGVGATQSVVPSYMVSEKKNFKYAGLVGARDMNYMEHRSFRLHLNSVGINNILIASDAKHRWASASDFRIALLWMQDQDATEFEKAVIQKITNEKDSLTTYDLILLNELVKSNVLTEDEKKLKKKLKEESKFIKKEQRLKMTIQDSIAAAFDLSKSNTKSVNWLRRQARALKSQKEKSDALFEIMMYDRLLNYMSAACYETSFMMRERGLFDEAIVGITIWESVSENTLYANWLKARIYAASNNNSLALEHLEAALKTGNVQKKSIFNEPDFAILTENGLFQNLIDKYYD